ncbi:motility protein A [Castellaniella daejeonensis]|jgi:chemotaxis protein MotA|uniref:Motility protein A n=1 Tax=Castellaniella daejeonensis TaxID=659013 RepID=A0ABN0TPA2_9BURK|nr:MotA/TolQ/ExbB proton channel family protein [Castellaniella sp.]HET8703290.1 MotA/TolQ/ExbB proton channel family protein [Castellaniella sp.]
MNPSTLIGIVASIVLLVIVLFLSAEDPGLFIDWPGLGIVLIGTAAATFIAYPLREVMRVFGLIRSVVHHERLDADKDLEDLVEIARIWMQSDIHAVEQALERVSSPFLRNGVQFVIDNVPEQDILDLLQWRIARMKAKEHAEAQLFRTMAGFAPAFGMLGTLVGLVNLLFLLGDGDITAIGRQMALALMTTFYGVLLANLVFKPIAVKLERRTEQRLILMNTLMQGIAMMSQKRSPALMRETLKAFIEDIRDEIRDQQPAPAATPGDKEPEPS